MSAIRIETLIEGKTLHLPQLKPLLGKSVEIVVTELPVKTSLPAGEEWASPLAGTVIDFRDPLAPAVAAEEWEANQ